MRFLLSAAVLLERPGDFLTLLVSRAALTTRACSSTTDSCFFDYFSILTLLRIAAMASCFLVVGGQIGASPRSALRFLVELALFLRVGLINWFSSSRCFLKETSILGSWKFGALGVVATNAPLFFSSCAAKSLCNFLKSGTAAPTLGLKDGVRCSYFFSRSFFF